LAGYAQLQNLILCNEYVIALDNDSNVTILKCKIQKPNFGQKGAGYGGSQGDLDDSRPNN